MTPADAGAVVASTTASLAETLTTILPLALPTLIVVGLLFWAIRKFVHNG